MMTIVSRTELARNTREIVDQVRKGQVVVVQSYGEDQVVLLDALDYRFLRALADYTVNAAPTPGEDALHETIRAYLEEQISLAKVAELLGISRFELMDRFERLGIPLRLGPSTMEEAQDEVSAARRVRES